jgi:DNA-binding MarR family transcriptional regulator
MAIDRTKESITLQSSLLNELMTELTRPSMEANDVSMAGFELLSVVKAGGGTLPQAELARRLGVSAPTLCEAVRSASARGLLVQKPHAKDSRAKTLTLTPKGARIVNEVLRKVNQAEDQMVLGIGDSELNAAIEVLKRINRNLARILNSGEDGDGRGMR